MRDHLVDEAIVLGFLGRHEEIPLGIAFDLVERLAGITVSKRSLTLVPAFLPVADPSEAPPAPSPSPSPPAAEAAAASAGAPDGKAAEAAEAGGGADAAAAAGAGGDAGG